MSVHQSDKPKRSYYEKLQDPRWQRKRLEVLNAAHWRCQECGAEDRTLAVHHSYYLTGKEPWEVEGDLLLALCQRHHEERQAIEQQIFVGIARRLCRLNLRGLRAVGDAGVPSVVVAAKTTEAMEAAAPAPPRRERGIVPPKQLLLSVDD